MASSGYGTNLKKLAKERGKREKFIKARMWFSTFTSLLFPDRVKIPDNIGNNVFIGNNQLVTRNNLTSFILIKEFSTKTPIAFISKLTKFVKTRVEGVSVDCVMKNSKMNISLTDSGLNSRVASWYRTLDNEKAPLRTKKRAARLIYSYDVAKSGEQFYRTIFVIQIRAKDGLKLKAAVSDATTFLASYEIQHRVVKSKLNILLQSILLVASRSVLRKKDVMYTIQSPLTMAELLPATQGHADTKGAFLGINRYNRYPYYWDFKSSAAGKNIAIYSPSGTGKTYLAQAWMLDFFAMLDNNSIMDLKGNEYSAFIKACGGLVIPMRPDTRRFINTFILDKERGKDDPVVYYADRFKLSVNLMKIIIDGSSAQESQIDTMLSKFLSNVYMGRGVTASNVNTWEESKGIHPLILAEAFRNFASTSVKEAYGDLVGITQSRFNQFFDKTGSHSYMFMDEYNFDDIYEAKNIQYDFGLLETAGVKDPVGFRVRTLFMEVINNEYSRYKKKCGEWMVQYMEEAQLTESVNGELMSMYAKEFSIRRSQNRVNVLLCNSVTAIKDNPKARPIIDNTNILVIGPVNDSSRNYLMKEYSLEKYEDTLKKLVDDPGYENTFFIVNRMKADTPPALIKIFNPAEVTKGILFKVVDIVE